jgi:hypothetical protein
MPEEGEIDLDRIPRLSRPAPFGLMTYKPIPSARVHKVVDDLLMAPRRY